jgi:hypothetical protein
VRTILVVGSVEARHAAVSLRRHLRKTEIIAGRDIVSLAAVQHPRKEFLAGAGPRVPAPAESAGAPAAHVMAGDATPS